MVVYNQWHRAAQQHLAHLQQEASATPAALVHQHRVALAEIQALERQRLHQEPQDLLVQHHSEPQQLVQPGDLRQQQ
jgi:hypothetical protein